MKHPEREQYFPDRYSLKLSPLDLINWYSQFANLLCSADCGLVPRLPMVDLLSFYGIYGTVPGRCCLMLIVGAGGAALVMGQLSAVSVLLRIITSGKPPQTHNHT